MVDVEKDFVLIDVPGMLRFSKRRSHREHVIQLYTSMCGFLQENALVTEQLIPPGEEVSDQLEVKRELFTDEGFEFYRTAVQKWLEATDRGAPVTDTSILERELKKMRAKQD